MSTAPTILVADDDPAIRFVLEAALTQAGYTPVLAKDGKELLALAEQGAGEAVITDVAMPGISGFEAMEALQKKRPGLPVIVISARHPLTTAVQSAQAGAFEFHAKPFDLHELMGSVARCLAARKPANDEPTALMQEGWLTGQSPAMKELYRTMARVVDLDLTVLITGASGTGKERVARALHELGHRASHRFITLSVAAIPKERVEAELFGQEKGEDGKKAGKFAAAEGGTLFLDEIGDMPLEAQSRLLRVLQEGEYLPVGGTVTKRSNVRIIAATQHDLRTRVAEGKFREDLFYRLQVIPLKLPTLAERREDIPLLAAQFLRRAPERGLPPKTLSDEGMAILSAYDWPGNVRELEHLLYRLAALVAESEIPVAAVKQELANLPLVAAKPVVAPIPSTSAKSSGTLQDVVRRQVEEYLSTHQNESDISELYDHVLRAVEQPMLEVVMKRARGNQLRAARWLGVNRNTLRKMLRRYGLI